MNSIPTKNLRLFLVLVSILSPSLFWGVLSAEDEDLDFAYLGVHTTRLDSGTSYQLGLPPGVHLQVERIVPNSPAERAGLQVFDVLIKLDDQLLINPDQLKYLLRLRNPGDHISLSLVRQGKKMSLSAELTEMPEELRKKTRASNHLFPSPDNPNYFNPHERMREFFRRHSFDFPFFDDTDRMPHLFELPPSKLDFSDPGFSAGDDDPLHGTGNDIQSYIYSSSTQQIRVNDEKGTIQWTEKDGMHFLRATDLEGKVVFEGPISTPEDRQNMPEQVEIRLRALQELGQIPDFKDI